MYVSAVALPVMVRAPVVVLNCRVGRRERGRNGGWKMGEDKGRRKGRGRRVDKEEEDRRGGIEVVRRKEEGGEGYKGVGEVNGGV